MMAFIFQQALSKSLAKSNIVWFLGKTEKRRALGLEMSRVFLGTVFQLVFQLVLVLGFTPWSSVRLSQLFSIGSSLLVVVKTATEVMTFKEEEEQNTEERSLRQVFTEFFSTKFELLKNVFRHLPLLLTNAVFNIGTISLLIAVAGGPAFSILMLSLVLDLAIFFVLPSCGFLVEKLGFQRDPKSTSMTSAVLMAWTNFFVLVGQPERKNSNFVCVLCRFVFNFATLLVLVALYSSTSTNSRTISIISSFLGVCGIIFISLFCNS